MRSKESTINATLQDASLKKKMQYNAGSSRQNRWNFIFLDAQH